MQNKINQARNLAAHALSRAGATGDFKQKEIWQQIAEQWLAHSETLERQLSGPQTPLTDDGLRDLLAQRFQHARHARNVKKVRPSERRSKPG